MYLDNAQFAYQREGCCLHLATKLTNKYDGFWQNQTAVRERKWLCLIEKNKEMRRRSTKKVSLGVTCYACDKPAVSREHAPPLSFFPTELRSNLITVPSCKTHNNDNSPDVEYVRNVIVHDYNSNEIARDLFDKKVKRSYERSPGLKYKTFTKYREVTVHGKRTAIVQANRTRYNRIMRGIASALYFHDFAEKFLYRWNVHPATMVSEGLAFYDLRDETTPQLNATLRNVPIADRDTNQPEVFKYGLYREMDALIYRFIFYGAVDIYVYGSASTQEPANEN